MIPKAITRELDKLVRDRDRWKRRALDRAAVRSKDRKREIEARDKAVEREDRRQGLGFHLLADAFGQKVAQVVNFITSDGKPCRHFMPATI